MKPAGLAPIIVLVIIAALTLGGAGYLILRQRPALPPNPAVSSSPEAAVPKTSPSPSPGTFIPNPSVSPLKTPPKTSPSPKISIIPAASPIQSPTPSPSFVLPPDTSPPFVTGFNADRLIDGRVRISVKFNEALNADSITSAAVYLTRTDNPLVRPDGTFEKSSNAFSFTVSSGLAADVNYTMWVKRGVKDLGGNTLESDFSCSFTWANSSIVGCPTGIFVTVKITSAGFSPAEVTIQRGATVVFKNEDTLSHWPASDPHPTHTLCPGFDALRGLNQGETYQHTFAQSQTCSYHDHLNPSLRGTVTAEE